MYQTKGSVTKSTKVLTSFLERSYISLRQIRLDIFHFSSQGLPPTEGSARRAKGVQFLKRRSIIAQGVGARPVGGAGGGAD